MTRQLGLFVGNRAILGGLLLAGLAASPAMGTVVQQVSATSSSGVPFVFEAQLTITGNTLTIVLCNNSTVHSQNPSDLLSSFYFDILDGGNNRPILTYTSATGDVWLTDQNNPDTLQTPGANLKAVVAGDDTWQFKTFNDALSPFLGFGIGTVGNSPGQQLQRQHRRRTQLLNLCR
jgi:hypothetical protein